MPKWHSINLPFRKRRIPLADALHFLQAVTEIMKRLQNNPAHLPDESDFILLQKISDEAQLVRLRAMHVHQCFHHRLQGEQEPPF